MNAETIASLALSAALAVVAPSAALAQTEAHGMSEPRLERFASLLSEHVARGELAGAVVAISRRGETALLRAYGSIELDPLRPMRTDAIFRIASMTKTFTSVALMILVEEGRVGLMDPVSRHLPEVSGLDVGIWNAAGELESQRPATTEMTVVDLLRHTSGLTYSSPRGLGELYDQHGLRSGQLSGDEVLAKLASLPLAEDPGTRFRYSLATDVVGILIERVSGQRLDRFLHDRIFTPLGMSDTGFVVADADLDRLVPIFLYRDGRLEVEESARESPLRHPPKTVSGGGGWGDTGSLGGAVTTASDLLRFYGMVLDGGARGDTRILSRASVELMLRDHLAGIPGPYPGVGFGLGFAVVIDPGQSPAQGSEGTVFWGGSENTFFFVDPQEDLVGLFLTQIHPFSHLDLNTRFNTLVYEAIVD